MDENSHGHLVLEGDYEHLGRFHRLFVEGEAWIPSDGQASLDLTWNLINSKLKPKGI